MENLQQTSTLWSTTTPEVRYLSYIDHIDQESYAPAPTCKFSISPVNRLKEKPVIIPLEKKCELSEPRPGHGMYRNMRKPISRETPATYAEEDTPDNPSFIIENDDKTLSYVPDKVAEDLVNNLINFLDTCDQQKIPVELKIALEEDSLNTPAPVPENTDEANNNYLDLSIDSWLTIDSISITPAVENVCLTKIEDFLEEF